MAAGGVQLVASLPETLSTWALPECWTAALSTVPRWEEVGLGRLGALGWCRLDR